MNNLLDLNNRGIFPGPKESLEHFSKRAQLAAKNETYPGVNRLQDLFGVKPDWVEIKIDQKGLLPWEAAATWIEEDETGFKTSHIQLKPNAFYLPEEIVAHELVHAMRLSFEEARFEEILAYRTSEKRFRRYFGPLFAKPKEVKGWLFLLITSWAIYWTQFAFEIEIGAEYFLWVPLLILGLGTIRLIRAQRLFSLALNNLEKTGVKALPIALRLSDEEILRFARNSSEEIRDFAQKQRQTDLRWQQLWDAYF